MDEFFVFLKAKFVKPFLDKVFYSFYIMVGDLFCILDFLRLFLIKLLMYRTEPGIIGFIKILQTGYFSLTKRDKVFYFYMDPVFDQCILRKVFRKVLCGISVTAVNRRNGLKR